MPGERPPNARDPPTQPQNSEPQNLRTSEPQNLRTPEPQNPNRLTITCLNIYYHDVGKPLHVELKSAKPFDLLEEETHLSIVRTAAVLEHAMAQVLKPYGLTSTQYNVLRILRGAGPGGLCRNEIGARLLRQVPDVTRLLDRLTAMR